ncbi:hypothetical protein ACHWQZ_G017297 [Mnemiopsis leidyi]
MSMNILEDQCPTCYRTFNPDVLKRHLPICNKVNTKVRKPMDIQKMRVAGTDIKLPPKNERVVEQKPKKSDWKEKHQEFLRNIRYAREAKAAEERGEVIAPPPPSQKPSDHVQCPTCGRSFNPNAAERHIKFCAEQAKRKPVGNQGKSVAAQRREKMKGFKSTFDKRKEQQQQAQTKNTDYSPSNYGGGGAPHSRTLRATENKSAPTPTRTGIPGRYTDKTEDQPVRPEKKLLNNLNARLNGGPPSRKVSSAKGTWSDTPTARAGSGGPRGPRGEPGSRNPPFCYDCGYKYPVKTAKFCCECGSPRLRNDQ